MRDFKGMKRQRGRNRGGGGGGGGGGGKPQQNANRAFDSNGPDGVKVRGNAQHVYEKYQQLARDAHSAGDRVLAENYLQHAEHYFRLLRAMQPQRPASEILGRDHFTSGFDIDFEDESGVPQATGETGEAEGSESESDRGGWQARDDRPREDVARDDRQRDERPRDERPRDDRPREDRPRGEGRRDRWRDERPRAEREPRPERDPIAAAEPQVAPPASADERPSPVLRDADGGESHAPAFLQNRAEPASDEEAVRRPRRRRAPRSFDDAPAEGPTPASEAEEV